MVKLNTQHSKGKIVVLDQRETSKNQELVDDLISIITVFSSESMDSVVIPSSEKSIEKLKTLKIRIFPTKEQEVKIQLMISYNHKSILWK
jgi:hypothetical protein